LPLLKEIQGRSTDFVVATDGTVMHGLALIYILRDLPGVEAFKVTQYTLQRCVIELVVDSCFERERHTTMIVDGVRSRLGRGVQVEVSYVAAISPEKSGKFRYIVSHVQAGRDERIGQRAGVARA
jgi:phenylacetate-CoA ligase